ncbi:MAG TPA: hypothetical protein VK053_18965 [Jiangellaceae bacterium]|nr:hypothetical protein [Jiangellaceae bacterium]
MRIYVGTSMIGLRQLHDEGRLTVETAYAVTPELREMYEEADAGDDPEELEFGAAGAAEEASLGVLAADLGLPARRVVVAADVEDEPGSSSDRHAAEPEAVPSAVEYQDDLHLAHIAAVHVDDTDAEVLVDQARRTDPEQAAQLLEDVALSWYPPEEIALVLGDAP